MKWARSNSVQLHSVTVLWNKWKIYFLLFRNLHMQLNYLLWKIPKRNLTAKSECFYYWTSKILPFIFKNTVMQCFIHVFLEVVLGRFSEWISQCFWMLELQCFISHPTKRTFNMTVAWQMTSKMCLAIYHGVSQVHRITLGTNPYKWAQENSSQAQGGGKKPLLVCRESIHIRSWCRIASELQIHIRSHPMWSSTWTILCFNLRHCKSHFKMSSLYTMLSTLLYGCLFQRRANCITFTKMYF